VNNPVNVAYASHYDTITAVARCRAQLRKSQPILLLVFCGGKHDPSVALAALRSEFGTIPVVGGSAAGAIGREGLGYSGLEIGIVAFDGTDLAPRIFVTRDLLENETEAGASLAREVAGHASDGAVVLLFFDSVATTSPLKLHYASAITDGFHTGLGRKRINLIGGGLLTDMNLTNGWVFDGTGICKHAAVALVFPPCVRAETVVVHGCRPVSSFMEITRIDGAVVHELDGEPALAVIERMLGLNLGSTDGSDLSLVATLGQKQGDPFAPYDENAYVNRLILGANRSDGSITLFEPDFQIGTRVQIMARDNALMLESARQGTAAITERCLPFDPFLALYVDCAGRASGRSGAALEEASLVVEGLDPDIPLLGFYSGVEIAPFDGYSRPLDWTGLLTLLRQVDV
jgi:hypothetical protein